MNKSELVATVATTTGTTQAASGAAVDAVFDAITTALRRGERVQLSGFGTFETRDRKARTARNPRTGEPIYVAASKAPAFKAGKALKDAIR